MATAMAMAMITPTNKMIMIDCHNHILFEVDDGSKSLQMSLDMLKLSASQGVSTIVLTPHINASESKVSRETHFDQYEILKKCAKDIPIELILGSELYIGQRLPKINFDSLVYGPKKTLLIEFSPFIETPIIDHTFNLLKKGYQVIVAHVERYNYLSLNDINELKQMGAILQVNTSSVLKTGHRMHVKKGLEYIKKNLIDLVSTDAHNLLRRPPNLLKARKALIKLVGIDKALSLTGDYAFKNIL